MGRHAIYIDLTEQIRSDISSFDDGWKLDAVRSYARRHGVSPSTVRKALAVLAEQGVIRSGEKGQYVRDRTTGWLNCPRRYPVVGLLSSVGLPLPQNDYVSRLLRSFISSVQTRRTPICLFPQIDLLAMRAVPGGVALGPSQIGCSAIAYLFGADEAHLKQWTDHGLVVMTLDYLSSTEGVDSVVVDCEDEAKQAVRHLAALGHKHIAFVGTAQIRNPRHWSDGVDPDVRRFSNEMLRVKQALGLDASTGYHELCGLDTLASDARLQQTLRKLLRLRPAPTAIVLFGLDLARQARALLQHWGIPCPASVSILGRGLEDEEGDITRLASDPVRIGNTAAMHILDRLSNFGCMATRLLFRSRLIEGSTSGPAPGP